MTVQRLYQAATGIVAATGKVTITFQPVPTLQMWTGALNVYNALGTETWQAQVSNAPWGTFIGNAQFGPIQASGAQSITITASGLVAGTVYNAALIGTSSDDGEVPYQFPQVQPLTIGQITSALNVVVTNALTAAVSSVAGNVSTFGAQEHLTNSPFSFTGSPQTQNFPLPGGGPSLDGLMIIPYPSNAGQSTGKITVVGHTTGVTYLATAISSAPFVCDFSSSADTGGVDVTFSLIGGAGSSCKIGVVGLNRSQIVRPVHGALAEGPAWAPAGARSVNGVAALLLSTANNSQYRIWGFLLSGLSTSASSGLASITVAATSIGQLEVPANGTTTTGFGIEGGIPIPGNVNVNVAGPNPGAASAVLYYSQDA